MKKRVFPIISAAVFAIFAAHLGYIYYRKIYNLCTEQTLEPGVGMYMEFSDMTPMAVFFIIAALIALATLVVLILRAVRPNLALGIVGSVLTVITCGIYFFSDLKYELFYMFKYVFGLSSAEAPILGMCEWFKIFFVFNNKNREGRVVRPVEKITFHNVILRAGKRFYKFKNCVPFGIAVVPSVINAK